MQITLEDVGKKFNHEWVFRKFTFQFNSGKSYAITGPNGSGKSTLLQVISGLMPANEGLISYTSSGKTYDVDEIYPFVDIAAPYQELVEEFTLKEFIDFHFSFKRLKSGISKQDIIGLMMLELATHKYIKHFSSGMKQRLKLALAFFSDSPVMLLDEPTSNLDEVGINWYMQNISEVLKDKLIIISSNTAAEYLFCDFTLNLQDFKPQKD